MNEKVEIYNNRHLIDYGGESESMFSSLLSYLSGDSNSEKPDSFQYSEKSHSNWTSRTKHSSEMKMPSAFTQLEVWNTKIWAYHMVRDTTIDPVNSYLWNKWSQWRPVYKGKSRVYTIHDLIPGKAYQFRVKS